MEVVHRKVQGWLLKKRSKNEKPGGSCLKKEDQTIRVEPATLASLQDLELMQL